MGFFDKLRDSLGSIGSAADDDGGSSETCLSCGTAMRGDGHFAVERFTCSSCSSEFYRNQSGVLTPYTAGSGRTCISCQQPIEGSAFTAQWEDGDNADAYVTCRHCGAQNVF